jgi:hypothetical protein
MRRVSIPGVLAGGFVDVVTSVVLGIPFSVIAVMHVDFAHTPKDQLQHAIQAAMHSNAVLYGRPVVGGGGVFSARRLHCRADCEAARNPQRFPLLLVVRSGRDMDDRGSHFR